MPNPLYIQKEQNKRNSRVGNLLNLAFPGSSLSSEWTAVGSPTTSVSNGDLILSAGAGNFSKYLYYNAYRTLLEDETITIYFKIDVAISGTSTGFSVGFHSASVGVRDMQFQFAFHTGNVGRIYFYFNGSLTTTGSTTIAAAQNDEMKATITRSGLTYSCTLDNLSNPTSQSILTKQLSEVYSQTVVTNALSYLAIYLHTGQYAIHNIVLSTTEVKNVDDLYIGDSITVGYYSASIAGNLDGRFANLISAAKGRSFMVRASGGMRLQDHSVDSAATNYELGKFRFSRIILLVGSNDVSAGRTLAQMQSDYQILRANVSPLCKKIIDCQLIPRIGLDMTQFNSWLASTYGAIDLYTPLANGNVLDAAYDSGDGVHPKDLGNALIGSLIQPYI